MFDKHVNASEIADRVRQDFVEHLNQATKFVSSPDEVLTRVGTVADKTTKEIVAGKRIDHRPIRMMTISGKGDLQNADWINVSLFDHSLNVACGAMRLAAHDLVHLDYTEEDLLPLLYKIAVIGFAHDLDKLYGVGWNEVDVNHCERFLHEWRLAEWLESVGETMSPSHLFAYISGVEVRSALNTPPNGTSSSVFDLARRYVRTADMLDSEILKSWKLSENRRVIDAWARVRKNGVLKSPSAFEDFALLSFTDVHNLFLLDAFQNMVMGACHAITGMPPLFSAVVDGTFTCYLPEHAKDDIVNAAIDDLIAALPLGTDIVVSSQGGVKFSGASPTLGSIDGLIRQVLPGAVGSKLFAVKGVDFSDDPETGSSLGSAHWEEITTLSARAGCPTVERPNETGLTYLLARKGDERAESADVHLAAKISFLISVREVTKSKAMSADARMKLLVEALEITLPDWILACDPLTRRTYVALSAALKLKSDDAALMSAFKAWQSSLLSENGLFSDYRDKADDVLRAIRSHFSAMALGHPAASSNEDAKYACIITGERVSDRWKLTATDKLHNIKSSAISYRDGRSESRFRELADTHISPVSYAEFKLRQSKQASSVCKGVPVKLISTNTMGLFGSQYAKDQGLVITKGGDVALFDTTRLDTAKITLNPVDSYRSPIRIGRFEDMGTTFSDRIDFILKAVTTCRRLGRPIHLFNGTPRVVPDFFYGDCLGRDVEALLGGSGLRIEELESALNKLKFVNFLAKARGEGGLGDPDLAKRFCYPATRFRASVLAWWQASRLEKNSEANKFAAMLFNETIPMEIEDMISQGEDIPEIKLARLARTFQKGPTYDESNNVLEFVVRTAFEQAEQLYKAGRRGKDLSALYIATIAETLYRDGKRRTETKGFFSAKETRPEGRSLTDQAEAIATVFVNEIWFGLLNGRPCKHALKRQFLASYVFAFKKNAN